MPARLAAKDVGEAAHVLAHVDFFKNNFMFRHTDRKMMDRMANHATRVRRYQDRLGVEKVEDFLKEGQVVQVKVLETDEKGRIKLSMKALLDRPAQGAQQQQQQQQ